MLDADFILCPDADFILCPLGGLRRVRAISCRRNVSPVARNKGDAVTY